MNRVVAFALALSIAGVASAGQTNSAFFFIEVPTLDEVGLAALIATVAGVAGWVVRRRGLRQRG